MPTYLDYNASTPMLPQVKEKIVSCLDLVGNPSTKTKSAGEIRNEIEIARKHISSLVDCDPSKIFFCSGATEANAVIIGSVTKSVMPIKSHFLTSTIEHKSVLDAFKQLNLNGCKADFVECDNNGTIPLEKVRLQLNKNTGFCSIMTVNNELGSIQPISKIAQMLNEKNILFHTDATQALGKIPFSASELNIDFASFSAHKIFGPKGIGAFYIKEPEKFNNLILFGGGQENGIRPGTENFLGIVGFGEACRLARENLNNNINRFLVLKQEIIQLLVKNLKSKIHINTNIPQSVPTCINFFVKGIDAQSFLKKNQSKYIFGTGSACNTSSKEPNHVLAAIGLSLEDSQSTIRLSYGHDQSDEEIIAAVKLMIQDLMNEF